MTEYLWLYSLLPAFVKWRYRRWSPGYVYTRGLDPAGQFAGSQRYQNKQSTKEEEEEEVKMEEEKEDEATGSQQIRTHVVLTKFPMYKAIKMGVFVLILFPLWIPLLLYYSALYIILGTLVLLFGIDTWHLMSFTILFSLRKNYWMFFNRLGGTNDDDDDDEED